MQDTWPNTWVLKAIFCTGGIQWKTQMTWLLTLRPCPLKNDILRCQCVYKSSEWLSSKQRYIQSLPHSTARSALLCNRRETFLRTRSIVLSNVESFDFIDKFHRHPRWNKTSLQLTPSRHHVKETIALACAPRWGEGVCASGTCVVVYSIRLILSGCCTLGFYLAFAFLIPSTPAFCDVPDGSASETLGWHRDRLSFELLLDTCTL